MDNSTILLTDLAWAAGIFDGEGCVTISLSVGANRKRPIHTLVCSVSMSHEATVRRLHSMFGGDIRVNKTENKTTMWTWRTSSEKALSFLTISQEFLFTKADQASVGIQFQTTKKRYKEIPIEEALYRDSFRKKLHSLNGHPNMKRREVDWEELYKE